MDNQLTSVLSNKVTIAGREVPVIVLGGAVGLAAALATIIARRNSGGGAVAPGNVQSVDNTAPADQWAALTDRVNQSLAAQSASIGGQFTALQSDIQGQLSAQQSATAAALAASQSQFAGSIAGLQTGQTQAAASLQNVMQNVNTLQQNYTAINQRVAAVEQSSAKTAKGTRNIARWIQRSLQPAVQNLPGSPAGGQTASEYTTNVVQFLGAYSPVNPPFGYEG